MKTEPTNLHNKRYVFLVESLSSNLIEGPLQNDLKCFQSLSLIGQFLQEVPAVVGKVHEYKWRFCIPLIPGES